MLGTGKRDSYHTLVNDKLQQIKIIQLNSAPVFIGDDYLVLTSFYSPATQECTFILYLI